MKEIKKIKTWWNRLDEQTRYGAKIAGSAGVVLSLYFLALGLVVCNGFTEKEEAVPLIEKKEKFVLPPRQNTGDTLYVLARNYKKWSVLRVVDNAGNVSDRGIAGTDYVNPGDTIVVEPKHNFMMKNITQNNMEQRWQKQK